jgi:hypothetical protein
VVFTEAALPAVEPIGYLLDDEEILFRFPAGGPLAAATRDTVVGFQTDDIDARTLSGWSVFGVGEAYEVVEPTRLAELSEGSAAPGAHFMCIVHNRDELLDLMADAVHATLAMPDRPSAGWRVDTTRIAHALRELYLRHPWLPTLFVTVGPHTLRLADRTAATTLAVTPDPAVADAINSTLLSFVRGAVLTEVMERTGEARPTHSDPPAIAARVEWQRAVITGGQYPAFVRATTAARARHGHASRFDFGLSRLLDGLEGFLRSDGGTT